MKKTHFAHMFLASCLFIVLSACSSSGEKEINYSTKEFSAGSIAQLIEITDVPAVLSYGAKESSDKQYLALKVNIKLAQAKPQYQHIAAQELDISDNKPLMSVNLVNADGIKVKTLNLSEEDALKFRKFLQDKKNTTATFNFIAEMDEGENVGDLFDDTQKFTPYETADIKGFNGKYELKGSIGKYGVTMRLEIKDERVLGEYYYDRYDETNKLNLSGENKDGAIYIHELTDTGFYSGFFSLDFNDGVLTGKFSSGTTFEDFPVNIQVTEKDISNISFKDHSYQF